MNTKLFKPLSERTDVAELESNNTRAKVLFALLLPDWGSTLIVLRGWPGIGIHSVPVVGVSVGHWGKGSPLIGVWVGPVPVHRRGRRRSITIPIVGVRVGVPVGLRAVGVSLGRWGQRVVVPVPAEAKELGIFFCH